MKITGQEIEDGVRAWIQEELKSGPAKEYDLGKFLFTVSSGTMGFLFLAERLTNNPHLDSSLIIAFFSLIFASGLSLFMIVPKGWEIKDDTDLFDKRIEIVRRTEYEAYIWFILWLIGMLCGIIAVLT
jgi:hypothetical protein